MIFAKDKDEHGETFSRIDTIDSGIEIFFSHSGSMCKIENSPLHDYANCEPCSESEFLKALEKAKKILGI